MPSPLPPVTGEISLLFICEIFKVFWVFDAENIYFRDLPNAEALKTEADRDTRADVLKGAMHRFLNPLLSKIVLWGYSDIELGRVVSIDRAVLCAADLKKVLDKLRRNVKLLDHDKYVLLAPL